MSQDSHNPVSCVLNLGRYVRDQWVPKRTQDACCRQLNCSIAWQWVSVKTSPPHQVVAVSTKEKIIHFQLIFYFPWYPFPQSSHVVRFVLKQMVCIRDVSGSTREKGKGIIQPSNTDVKNKNKKEHNLIRFTCCYPNFPLAEQMGLMGPSVPHSTSLKSTELYARGEFGLTSFLSVKEMESLGAFCCLGLVLEFGVFSFSEKIKTQGGECMTFLLLDS